MSIISFISERVKDFFKTGNSGKAEETEASEFIGREKVIVFTAAVFFSLCLWFIVNLSRDFNITIEVPIQLVNLPENIALSSDIPEYASVNLTGEGWKLIPLYRNPPRVNLSADSRQINLFEQMRSQVGAFSDLNVLQVEPIILNIETEERITKTVPVVSQVSLNLRSQYGIVEEPVITPDSVRITGAQSKLAEINSWETVELELRDVNRNLERTVQLKQPATGITMQPTAVTYRASISEFTESEVRIPVRTRNLPSGKAVTYNPSSITVRFDVPIDRYSDAQNARPFIAYVDYAVLESDTTGFITPTVERVSTDINVRLRGFQPTTISYFNILPD